ncbi:sensor histidine kinase [Brevibacillus composti]|uniref:histidine kinase n=1 Tax=Brevibacillus composti TaxID=2796470 RepID=A0A7T5EJV3_9BACL|nr:ATP-binding protein [Brevibacillus composti]QQE73972.1 sensor histidine kinase [Brevibacillus composti]QUO41056.1 sensor histidine kinase [Brevibacillus composti]
MISNWFSRHRPWKRDVFVHTQARLALQYSAIMMIFLSLFITIVYFLVDFAVFYEQEKQLHASTEQQVQAIKEALPEENLGDMELDDELNTIRESGKQFFYYFIEPDGQLIIGDEWNRRLQPELLEMVKDWIPGKREVRYESMTLSPPSYKRGDNAASNSHMAKERDIQLMMTGRAVYDNRQLVGFLYTGRDITFTYELTKRLLTVLIVLGILFLGVAVLLSYFMSKRAMIPIRQSFQRQKEFIADASHELRTPLSILHSSLDVFEMEDGEHLSDFSKNVLVNMKNEVKRMAKMVSDLLTLARSDTDRPDALIFEPFDLASSAGQLVHSTRTLAQQRNLHLHFHAPASLPMYGDPERIKQLLYILLDNAIKYTPPGGEIHLSLSKDLTDKHPVLLVKVRDSGIGIPPGHIDRIFDRFYRVEKNRSRQMGGMGLGLSIAKWIVEAHDGTISVSSAPGQGSTFTVSIPLTKKRT